MPLISKADVQPAGSAAPTSMISAAPQRLSYAALSAAVTLASLAAMAEEVAAGAALQALLPGTRARKCAVVSVVRLCQEDVGYTDLRIAGERRLLVPLLAAV